jgi:xylan 1,4-beta-xylosidase
LQARDPYIIREGDRYWLAFTMWPFSGREMKRLAELYGGASRGIALFFSPDLKSWRFETWLVKSSELPADRPYKHRFWAPETPPRPLPLLALRPRPALRP